MELKAIFFDMGGTIETFNHTPSMRLDATPDFIGLLSSHGINLDLSVEEMYSVLTAGLDTYHQWSLEIGTELSPGIVFRNYIFKNFPQLHTRIDPISEELMTWIDTHYYERAMRPEIPHVLKQIKAMGLKMGVISNVCSRGQVPGNLEKYGLSGYFDTVVLSSEYSRRKPDPAIFQYAASLINVPASSCIYVGDRISRDVLGAKRAGFGKAIQIHHDFDHGEPDEGAVPDVVIHSMDELVEIIQKEKSLSEAQDTEVGPVKAFLFDAGDILYYRPHRGRKFFRFLESAGIESKIPYHSMRKDLREKAYRGMVARDYYLSEVVKSYGVNDPAMVKKGVQVLDEEDDDIHFFDGVPDTLQCLKERGYLLGIITDTAHPTHMKLRWFEKGGFGHLWDSIVSSVEMGTRKPDKRMYLSAVNQLGIAPQQAVFVGHKKTELDGAKDAGISTIAFNYEESSQADHYINHFSDLLKLPFINKPNQE